jgi:cellulose synthase operon protein C
MARPCDQVELFVDGELPFEEAEAFRNHFPDCVRCQAEVGNLMQLKLLGYRYVRRTAEQAGGKVSRSGSRGRWGFPVLLAAASLAAAMVVAVALPPISTPSLQHDALRLERPERLLEARLSYRVADRHRPMASTMMGGHGAAEELPLEDMAVLQKTDEHGLSAAYLIHDEPEKAERVLKKLREQGRTPEMDSDLAVAKLMQGKSREALQLLDEVLAEHPRHPQALWNRGLALRELGLPLMAAQAFLQVAALKEPGWSEEAEQRAKALQSATYERRDRWEAVFNAGRALREIPPGTLPNGFDQVPSSRRLFYDAVRSVPSRERVLALLPIAQMLDAQAGGNVLERYVLRVAEADFTRRTPLARTYADLVWGRIPAQLHEQYLKTFLDGKEDDILLGVLGIMNATARYQPLFEAKAAASGDPWLQMLAVQKRAEVELAAGRVKPAVEQLLKERRPCTRGFEYLCISLDTFLSTLYLKLQQTDEARQYAELAWKAARENGDWGLEQGPLWNLAQIARFGNDTALARAYLGEFLEHKRGDADAERRLHQDLAIMAMEELRVYEARQEINAALATGLPLALSGAFALADISRLEEAYGDEQHLTEALDKAQSHLSPGERAIATHVLGRFFIERDAERGRSLLWRAIEEADAPGLGDDNAARRARAYSFTSLMLEAGRRGAFKEALELFARERGGELPRRCLLAATVDSERTLFLALGPTRELVGSYDASRRHALPQRLDFLAPESLVRYLRACEQVEVLARPPLHGRAGLLPSELAWSYLTSKSAPRRPPAGKAVHLVVSDVKLPPEVSLKRLNDWTPTFGPDEQQIKLSGSEATPSKVLSAMKNATEIDLVAHGIINDYSDTSYLVLAPGPEGSELGVSKVRTASLQGAPFVVLAACHAAHATYSLDDPFSLPAAFIEAGARGVLAATVEIPDREAEAFFNAIRERLRSGMAPKLALRDERVRWLREGRGAQWLGSVLLFE